MFTPQILSIPVLSVLGSGTVLYPTVGAVLAWTVIAAFVGSALGLLRESLRPAKRRDARAAKAADRPVAPVLRPEECCEVA